MDEIKLKESIASLMKDKTKRDALAELITEYIQPGHITTDFISLLLNTRALNPGDSLVKKVRKGIKVYTLVPGAIHLASEITVSDRMNYILDGADVKVTANEWELASGELGTVENIRTEAMAKLRDYYLGKISAGLASVWSAVNTPLNYVDAGGSITANILKAAIDRINQTTPGVKAVVGLRSLLTPITVFGAGWTDGAGNQQIVSENIREIMSTGWLGRYYGAPIIALNQIYDNAEDYNAMIPTDKVVVIGENAGEFVTFGGPRTKEWTDMRPTPPQWYYEIYEQFGLIIDNAQGLYVIKCT